MYVCMYVCVWDFRYSWGFDKAKQLIYHCKPDIQINGCTLTHAHTYTHTYIHTYTHTYTHTYIHT